MKAKSKLRAFIAIASSSLLAANSASAATYYWDGNDGTAGFQDTNPGPAGTWSASTPSTATGGFTTDASGATAISANPAVATTTSDDLFFGTGPEPTAPPLYSFTGAITIDGTVNAKSIYQSANHPTFAGINNPTVNFPAVGSWEHATEGTITLPALTITGATTSMTWKAGFIDNLVIENVINGAAKNIFEGTGSFIAIKGGPELGPVGTPIVLNGGGLRLSNGFPYPTMSAFNAAYPITINPNVSFGLAPFGFAFTLDTTLGLGTGGLYIAGQNASSPLSITAPQTHTGGTFLVSGVVEISDNAHLGDITSPLVFGSGPSGTGEGANGTLRITGTTMTSLGARPLVHTPDKGVAFDIADAANTFTLDQGLTQGAGGFTKSGPGTMIINTTTPSTYTGTTIITGGKLSYGNAAGLPTTAVNVNGADAVLDIAAFNPTLTTLTVAAGTIMGTGTITATGTTTTTGFVFNGATNVSIPVKLAGAATLTKTAAGTATLSGANTYTGTTTVSGGSLTVEGSHTGGGFTIANTAAATSLTFAAGSTTSITSGNISTLSGGGSAGRSIVVNGSVTSSTTSNITIGGRNSLSINNGGSLTMQGGTLTITGGNSGYSVNASVNAGGSLTYGGNDDIILAKSSASNSFSANLNLRGTFTTTRGFINTGAGAGTGTSNFTFDGGLLKISNDIAALFSEVPSRPFNVIVAAGGGIIDTNGFNTATSLAVSGAGGLTKAGGGKLTLSGTNTYAGDTTVTGGTLALAVTNANNNASTVTISGTGVLELNNTATEVVDKLFIGTTQKAAGVYGKVGSASPVIGIPQITGDGTLTVTSGPTLTPFEIYMADYPSLTGNDALPEADPDGDGKNNKFEFAFKGDPTNPSDNGLVASLVQDTSSPADTNELTLVVAVRDGATFANAGSPVVQTTTVDGVTYTIEGTLDLVTIPGSNVSHVGSPSNTAPVATGLPDLTGTAWEYHTFKLDASEGLGSKGFLRAKVE